MQTVIVPAEGAGFLRRLSFPLEVEREFQESYYFRMLPGIRTSILFMLVLSLVSVPIAAKSHGGDSYRLTHPSTLFIIGAYVLYLLSLVASFRPKAFLYWQSAIVVSTLVFLAGTEFAIETPLAGANLVCLGIIWSRLQRLQFRWMAAQLAGVVIISLFGSAPHITGLEPNEVAFFHFLFAIAIVLFLIVLSIPLIWTYRVERFERSEFLVKYLLAQERNEERLKREHSEQMLHILSQAIGSIVHDLGNPLTAVQGGAQTLLEFAKDGQPDREMVQEFATMITDGAQMLNYLRLSLMEQTRVLENKPVPVKPVPTSLREMVKSGIHYQKPKFATGRDVSFEGDDVKVCVDEMRFITILMNLIGNALKYSDGAVRITWRPHGEQVLIAVQDQGQGSMGISQAQAEKLFVAFGRLDTHTQIEGTGLGLLSVRNIAQAHGGEVYIEGYCHGSADSSPFCTAQGRYPTMREADFKTAFVTTCPLDSMPKAESKKVLLESAA